MTPETSTPSRRRGFVGWGLLAVLLALLAWASWREYNYRAAVREARAAGWQWEAREPFDLILADWHVARRIETWTRRYRRLYLPGWTNLASARPLIVRLQPTTLVSAQCPDADLEAFRSLSALKALQLIDCTALQNVDALTGLSELKHVSLYDCTGLQNLDGLKGLSALQSLDLRGSTAIPSPALRELRAALPKTDIIFPDGSKAPPP